MGGGGEKVLEGKSHFLEALMSPPVYTVWQDGRMGVKKDQVLPKTLLIHAQLELNSALWTEKVEVNLLLFRDYKCG